MLVWFADGDRSKAEIKRNPLYAKLDVSKEDRDVFIGGEDRVYDATSFVSVLSMPTLMKELVPRLAAAADGDPATSTDQRLAVRNRTRPLPAPAGGGSVPAGS